MSVEASPSSQWVGGGPEVLEAPKCLHRWMIDPPAGPSSKGVCRLCGEERQFQNYIEGTSWGYDSSPEHLSGGTRYPINRNVVANRDQDEDE